MKFPSDNEVCGFPYLTLPFGAVASVLHFDRFARYIQRVFWHLEIISSNYFDDYPVLEMSQLCSNTDSTMKAFQAFASLFFSCIAERARGMVGQLSRNAKAKKGEPGITCRSLSTA